jgi:hypothetical protein
MAFYPRKREHGQQAARVESRAGVRLGISFFRNAGLWRHCGSRDIHDLR